MVGESFEHLVAHGCQQILVVREVTVGGRGGDSGPACGLAQDDGGGTTGRSEVDADPDQCGTEIAMTVSGACMGAVDGVHIASVR
ncbi:hypothetical protein GCM10023167_01600 [Brevibacterium pityocampae]|uniref:Uncharacterized protein n=1 Tax=Brevibacterium pityocampae TaxID=506594 RepID=A0ABP8J0K6_9MICO